MAEKNDGKFNMIPGTKYKSHHSIFLYKQLDPFDETDKNNLSYRVLSFHSKKEFLILETSKYFQKIIKCTIGSSNQEIIASIPNNKKVVSASLSPNEKLLFIVIYNYSGIFSNTNYYNVDCLITNTDIFYPITTPSEKCPIIDFIDSNGGTKFIISGDSQYYEIYDLNCSETEFNCRLDKKSKHRVSWWSLNNRIKFECIKYYSKKNIYSFVSDDHFPLPLFPNPFPEDFYFLSSKNGQKIVLYSTNEIFCLVLPGSLFQLQLKYSHAIDIKLSSFSFFSNDLLVVLSPQITLLFVLLDYYSRPRALFEIILSEDCKEQYIMVSSPTKRTCIDVRNCSQYFMKLDFISLVNNEPRIFVPLLHYEMLHSSFIKSNDPYTLLCHINESILQTFWNGLIFEEYFLNVFQTREKASFSPQQFDLLSKTISTFCQKSYFKHELSFFQLYENNSISEVLEFPTPVTNWGTVNTKYYDIFSTVPKNNSTTNNDKTFISIKSKLIESLNSFNIDKFNDSLRFPILLQLMATMFRITNVFEIQNIINSSKNPENDQKDENHACPSKSNLISSFENNIANKFSSTIYEFWEAHNIVEGTGKIIEEIPRIDKPLTRNSIRKSWWNIRQMTQITQFTNKVFGLYDVITEATQETKESNLEYNILAFYKSIFNNSYDFNDL